MIREESIVLRHEPQVCLRAGKIVGTEVVPRQDGQGRLDTRLLSNTVSLRGGFSVPLGEWTLRQACLQVGRWHNEGAQRVRVTVKVSVQELHQDWYVDTVRSALRETSLDPRCLELEVQEAAAVNHLDGIAYTLGKLRDLGVQLALGSFGTGRCTLDSLRRLRCNRLKIHPSFLQATAESNRLPVARAIVMLAKGLNLSVTADGIESKRVLDVLADYGCDEGQGSYFGGLIPSPAFAAALWVAVTKGGQWSIPPAWAS
jgi:EAL domain-containing protein (putative c-di-GMP-specific phosphodiesterase class I)